MEAGERVLGDVVVDARLDVARRAQVEGDAAVAERGAQVRVVGRDGAVGDPLRPKLERATDLRRAAPFARVAGDPQAGRARDIERRRVRERIREALLLAGQVPAHDAAVAQAAGHLGERAVGLGIGPTDRGDDEPRHDRMARGGRAARPFVGAVRDGGDDLGGREAGRRVEARRPADLHVADAVGGLGLDELGGDPGERFGVLEQADRQVERAQQLGL